MDMKHISSLIDDSLSGADMQSIVSSDEVIIAMNKRKAAKSDGAVGLSWYDLTVCISLLCNALLFHAALLLMSLLLHCHSYSQRPKGLNPNDSANYIEASY